MKKHKYLVGFNYDGSAMYGKDSKVDMRLISGGNQWADPMTLLQAKRKKAEIQKVNAPRVLVIIYELRPTKE